MSNHDDDEFDATATGVRITEKDFYIAAVKATALDQTYKRDGTHGPELAIIVNGDLKFHSFIDEAGERLFYAIQSVINDETGELVKENIPRDLIH